MSNFIRKYRLFLRKISKLLKNQRLRTVTIAKTGKATMPAGKKFEKKNGFPVKTTAAEAYIE